MEWLNYHHLLYFWVVAKEGSIARACEVLYLAQPTISGQIRALEEALGEKLFSRSGRSLVMTETGQVVFRYADEIFSLGRELMNTLKGRPSGRPMRLIVGLVDVVPKLLAFDLLQPALDLPEKIQIVCHEGKLEHLLGELSVHRYDMVLSDSPMGPSSNVRAFNHLLGECGVSVFGKKSLCDRYREGFPKSLNGAPFLLPTPSTTLRRSLDQWFEENEIHPTIVAEFEDSALARVFSQEEAGFFVTSTPLRERICTQSALECLGEIEGIRERYYAISVERKLKHPAVVAISEAARDKVFG